ncbi:MAG TPA: mechanosensitive ion channel domain-containing protein, partial [Sumerlaeia bacterium]|nr:mechanosensitive ion channel domain-containing protein [Sumerlaeia bacterium]
LIARRLMLAALRRIIRLTKTTRDDVFLERKVFDRLAYLAPAIVIHAAAPVMFFDWGRAAEVTQVALKIYMIVVGLWVVDSFLNALVDIYRTFDISRRLPIKVFVQVGKIVLFIAGAVSILSLLVGKSPVVFLSGLGALTAVLMLVFKDPILGLVAGIQLIGNNMVRRGDWIEMPKYGADGDVIDVTLTTVKVQNWDKTISTIPTYALISDSFKNWRGMSESGGRRIKRSVHIDMTSIKFCTEEMLERFKRFQFITEYIERKKEEVARHNKERYVDESELVNGRRLTNIGTFRAYVGAYLRNHPKIHQDMTFLVRHLQPAENGLPIEIYVFSNDQVWANYEAIQADIFDHILAVVPQFDLRVFQNPSGGDFRAWRASVAGELAPPR